MTEQDIWEANQIRAAVDGGGSNAAVGGDPDHPMLSDDEDMFMPDAIDFVTSALEEGKEIVKEEDAAAIAKAAEEKVCFLCWL